MAKGDNHIAAEVERVTTRWGKYVLRIDESDWFGFIAGLALFLCVGFGLVVLAEKWPTYSRVKTATTKELTCLGLWKASILAFWIVVPPFWFWAEHFGIWKPTFRANVTLSRNSRVGENGNEHNDDKLKNFLHEWDMFKYGQDLCAKIWLAGVTALTILYFGKDVS